MPIERAARMRFCTAGYTDAYVGPTSISPSSSVTAIEIRGIEHEHHRRSRADRVGEMARRRPVALVPALRSSSLNGGISVSTAGS